jgi:hypothetical protein
MKSNSCGVLALRCLEGLYCLESTSASGTTKGPEVGSLKVACSMDAILARRDVVAMFYDFTFVSAEDDRY